MFDYMIFAIFFVLFSSNLFLCWPRSNSIDFGRVQSEVFDSASTTRHFGAMLLFTLAIHTHFVSLLSLRCALCLYEIICWNAGTASSEKSTAQIYQMIGRKKGCWPLKISEAKCLLLPAFSSRTLSLSPPPNPWNSIKSGAVAWENVEIKTLKLIAKRCRVHVGSEEFVESNPDDTILNCTRFGNFDRPTWNLAKIGMKETFMEFKCVKHMFLDGNVCLVNHALSAISFSRVGEEVCQPGYCLWEGYFISRIGCMSVKCTVSYSLFSMEFCDQHHSKWKWNV